MLEYFKKLLAVFCVIAIAAVKLDACSVAFFTGKAIDDGSSTMVYLTGRTADFIKVIDPDYKHKINIFPRGLPCNGDSGFEDVSVKNPIKWISKYASLVFDDFIDGVNEKGLCVHPLYLDKTVYPEFDEDLKGISSQKITQYLLDNAANVQECIDLLENVNIVMDKFGTAIRGEFPTHWAIRDASNNVAFIEYINIGNKYKPISKKVIYQGLEHDVLTNEPYYNMQLKYFDKFKNGKRGLPGDFNAMARFVRLKMFKETLPKQSERQSLINNMYSLMSSVHCIPGVVDYGHKEPKYEKQWPTAWTVVFDITELTYYVKMTASPNRIWIDLNKFDFDTLQKVGILDVEDTGLMGEANDKIAWQ